MHIDLNSCFATIEQQSNPLLRGKPLAVAAYTTPRGCIIAPSIEAKRLGIKVGMRVMDGKQIYPKLIVLPPDPWKYRNVHLKLRELLSNYTPDVVAKSIDEFVLDFNSLSYGNNPLGNVAKDIKKRIKEEIGEWLSVSIGIAPNRYLAKLAAGLNKPDGLREINKDTFLKVYSNLKLTDLPWIKSGNAARLNSMEIFNVLDFYHAPLWKLKAAFASISSYYWFMRLRGFEVDQVEFGRRSYGNSYALSKPLFSPDMIAPILSKLVEKMTFRMRTAGFKARGVHLSILYRDFNFWHKGVSFPKSLFDSRDVYKKVYSLMLVGLCGKPVREISVSCFGLEKTESIQLDIFEDKEKSFRLIKSVDKINKRWGRFVLGPARMLYNDKSVVPDRIAFGGVKELEEFTLQS